MKKWQTKVPKKSFFSQKSMYKAFFKISKCFTFLIDGHLKNIIPTCLKSSKTERSQKTFLRSLLIYIKNDLSMPKSPCYLRWKTCNGCAARVKIKIETWNLGDIFLYLFRTTWTSVSIKIRKYPKLGPP